MNRRRGRDMLKGENGLVALQSIAKGSEKHSGLGVAWPVFVSVYRPPAARKRSASMAAAQPIPAAVMACR